MEEEDLLVLNDLKEYINATKKAELQNTKVKEIRDPNYKASLKEIKTDAIKRLNKYNIEREL